MIHLRAFKNNAGILMRNLLEMNGSHQNVQLGSTRLINQVRVDTDISTENESIRSKGGSKQDKNQILPNIINRNPRNMELMLLARKPFGYSFLDGLTNYYNCLCFEIKNNYMVGYVKHYTGAVLIKASTKEIGIRKHLASPIDICSASNVAKVLVDRCMQAGYLEMATDLRKEMKQSKKVLKFVKTVQKTIKLYERAQLPQHNNQPSRTASYPWQFTEDDCEMYEYSDIKNPNVQRAELRSEDYDFKVEYQKENS